MWRCLHHESFLESTWPAIDRSRPNHGRPSAHPRPTRLHRQTSPRKLVNQIRPNSPKFAQTNSTDSAAAVSPVQQTADELVDFASDHSALAHRIHASAKSTNSYAHGAADHSPVAQTFSRRRLQSHPLTLGAHNELSAFNAHPDLPPFTEKATC